MKRLGWLAAVLLVAFATAGCGGGGGGGGDGGGVAPLIIRDIVSDPAIDGDIDETGVITEGAGTVLAGVDPVSGIERRGFLSFPLDSIPADADVRFASLDVFVDDLFPIRITPIVFTFDLVSFGDLLFSTDFFLADLPFILSGDFDFFDTDFGNVVSMDVTLMVQEAFRLGLTDAQFRVRLGDAEPVGELTIADPFPTTLDSPLLHVEFF